MSDLSGIRSNSVSLPTPSVSGSVLSSRLRTVEEFFGSPFFIAEALKAFERAVRKAVAEDQIRKEGPPAPP
jgi:hypothetical protein